MFLKLGLINFDLIKLFFYAYHQAIQFAHYHEAPENYKGENRIKTLPQDLLPDIIKQSNVCFALLPQGFFKHAVAHGYKKYADNMNLREVNNPSSGGS